MTSMQDDNEGTQTFTAEQMAEVRAEAKAWRQKLRAAEAERDQLRTEVDELTTTSARTAEERDKAIAELDTLKTAGELAEATREIAAANGIPAEALRGSTREELEAHAAVLKPVFAKAEGPYAPRIGESPEHHTSEEAAFAAALFNSN